MNNAHLQKNINQVSDINEAPIDGIAYGRKNASWVSVPEEAPIDGKIYNRKDGNWIETFADAPVDGTIYARKDNTWENVPEEAPADGNTYGRKDNVWVIIAGGGIPDAPADDQTYARRNNAWVKATTIGVGGTETKIAGQVPPLFSNIFTWMVGLNTEPISLNVDLLAYRDGNLDQAGRFILEGSFWRGGGNVRSDYISRSMENISSSQNLRLVSSGADTVFLQLRTIGATLNYRAIVTVNPWGAFI